MHPVLAFAIGLVFTLTFRLVWCLAKRDVDAEAGVCRGMMTKEEAIEQEGRPICPHCHGVI